MSHYDNKSWYLFINEIHILEISLEVRCLNAPKDIMRDE